MVYNRRSGIESPKDLEGRKVGARSYTFTPGVWTRGILSSEYGVDLGAVTWVLSGDEHVEEYAAPPNVVSSLSNDLAEMLLSGEIDAAILPGPVDSPDILPLFPEAHEADDAWHKKTGLYPISHLLVVKDATLEANEALATELFDAFSQAKALHLPSLQAGKASDAMDNTMLRLGEIVGDDPIPYGYERARETLETFIGFNVEQGVIPEAVDPAWPVRAGDSFAWRFRLVAIGGDALVRFRDRCSSSDRIRLIAIRAEVIHVYARVLSGVSG